MNQKQVNSGYWKGFLLGLVLFLFYFYSQIDLLTPTIIGLFIILLSKPRNRHIFKDFDNHSTN